MLSLSHTEVLNVHLVVTYLGICRTPIYPHLILINGEDGPNFVAGLAEDIGIENVRAARIVSAAVAARMRSYFLQAWVNIFIIFHDLLEIVGLSLCERRY